MLTFFTTAKPFKGHSGIIQRNALQSWKLLHPEVEVILFGDEPGAAETCAELGLRHEPEVERHESGMKYLDYMFACAQVIARHDCLCYANGDIVLMKDFRAAVEKAVAWRKRFLMIGQRWDTDVTEPIDFGLTNWEKALRHAALTTGHQQDLNFVDFFVFPRGLYNYVPNLVVGRSAWDHWLVWKALDSRAQVLDCTAFVLAVHQNHDYAYHPRGKMGTCFDVLARRNVELCAEGKHMRGIIDSTHKITGRGGIRRTPLRKFFHTSPAGKWLRRMWQGFLINTFPGRRLLGLRREALKGILERHRESLD